MRKISPALPLILLIALSVCTYQQLKISQLKKDLEESHHSESAANLSSGAAAGSSSDVTSGRKIPSSMNRVAPPRGATANSQQRRGLNSREQRMALIKKGMLASFHGIYGPFIEKLSLNEEENDYFESLLAERLFTRRELSHQWASASDFLRAELEEETRKRQSLNQAQIKRFLNFEDEYQAFLKYEARIPEHLCLSGISGALSSKPMTPSQTTDLIEVLYECRSSSEGTLQDGLSNWLAITKRPAPKEQQRQWEKADQRLSELLPEVLHDEQQDLFLEYWNTLRDAQKKELFASQGN